MCIAKMRRSVMQMMKMKLSWKELTVLLAVFLVFYFSGLSRYLFEKNYYTEFTYPLDVNVLKLISQLKAKRKPEVEPINKFQYKYISEGSGRKCRNDLGTMQTIRLLYVVKSACGHFNNRQAIRETWGRENRFSDVSIRVVFLLGTLPPDTPDAVQFQLQITAEQHKYKDVIQSDFVDSYFNNTIKTLMGLHWVVNHCSKAEFIFFVDDDYYVSTKNVLRYLRKPNFYPRHLQKPFFSDSDTRFAPPKGRNRGDGDQDEELKNLAESPMYVGFVFPSSKPHRIQTSKWVIDLEEYPYSRFPPYVTAGAYILSTESLFMFYYASLFTKPFRFDDIYLGILAKKCYVDPVHNPYFHFYKLPYSKDAYEFCIASHGYENHEELIKVWNQQHSLGNA